MSIAHSHLTTATTLVSTYQKGKPLVHHLKSFFSQHKKMGSRDRKAISQLCYAYFRCFGCLDSIPDTKDKIIASWFLTQDAPNVFLEKLNPQWNAQITLSISEKCDLLGLEHHHFFRFSSLLSPKINSENISFSLLCQPDLFLRIRPGHHEHVTLALNEANLMFEMNEDTIRLKNGTKIEDLLSLDKEVVVQDLSTQKTFSQLDADIFPSGELSVWDCCAASGGKSILISDILGKRIKLTSTDIRNNILVTMKERLQKARVGLHRSFSTDLTINSGMTEADQFDLIIADVPCTGSGTWSRTPEQHFSFDDSMLSEFQETQRKIIHSVVPHLKKGGILVYSTCSVFHDENEMQVSFFESKYGLKKRNESYFDGTSLKSDTLFSAILIK